MNWINELCDLYDKKADIVGQILFKTYQNKNGQELRTPLVLLPIFHTTAAAQITVTINQRGDLLQVDSVPEEDKLTIIPTTDISASRTSGIAPHPLCDSLKYLAGDYRDYCLKDGEKEFKKYDTYMQALEAWNQSPYSHQKVQAIYLYLQKGSLIKDLVAGGILFLDENGKFAKNRKLQKIAQEDAFVRFRIEELTEIGEDILGDSSGRFASECWLDRTLQQKYIEYHQSTLAESDLCYLTGKQQPISYFHPRKIRNEGDGAKLISANDETNYTFRGRFRNKQEAFAIGYEISQKAHNALKWIIRNQGSNWDGFCIVVWESDLHKIPDWSADTEQITLGYLQEFAAWEDDEDSQEFNSEATYWGTNEAGAARFRSAILGYERQLGDLSKIILMAFDAATTGRLAMTEQRVLMSSRYLANIKSWHESCQWRHSKYANKRNYNYLGMMGIYEIAEVLYGTEQDGIISLGGKTNRHAEVCQRLRPCIIDGQPIPADMVNLAIHKASSPLAYKKDYNWQRVLALACSLVKKQVNEKHKDQENKYEKNEVEWTVALNSKSQDRNYLYGRLLAVADRVEYLTFLQGKDDGRETNAKRYMCNFSRRPFQSWKVIEEKLEPYFRKLKIGQRIYYQNLINEICQGFDESSFANNERLNGLYLLGFHSQSYVLKNKPAAENIAENI